MLTLDIIVPVYNEEKFLEKVIEKIESVNFCNIEKHIIFVNDGSSDSSQRIIEKYPQYTLINHPHNLGKGAAIATGLKHSKSDIIIIQDADLEYNFDDYNIILQQIVDNKYDVVYGSRFKSKSAKDIFSSFMPSSYIANTVLTFLMNVVFGCNLTDVETCYKAFRKNVLENIEIKSLKYDFEIEITAKIIKKGIKIQEVPILYRSRSYNEGKKVTWKDGLVALGAIIYYRFFN